MAMLASVTVSIGEETRGVFMVICLVSAEVRSCAKEIGENISKQFSAILTKSSPGMKMLRPI